jgi:hypothetical protein
MTGIRNDETSRAMSYSARDLVRLSGVLLVAGVIFNGIVTMAWHPSGAENDHPEIFAEYAASDGWVMTHFGQFLGVSVALAGLFVLCYAIRTPSRGWLLARFGMAALVGTVTAFAILQGLDGIALKQNVVAWVEASGTEKDLRFDDAETVRWLEWGFQSYFRVLLGVSLLLSGAAVLVSRLIAGWLGYVLILAGALSIAIGIDVGYSGLESGFQDVIGPASQLLLLIGAIGILVAGVQGRARDPVEARAG